jgi:hypothetical protein
LDRLSKTTGPQTRRQLGRRSHHCHFKFDAPLSFGMPACSVGTDNDIADALSRALAERGPRLIEDVIG